MSNFIKVATFMNSSIFFVFSEPDTELELKSELESDTE